MGPSTRSFTCKAIPPMTKSSCTDNINQPIYSGSTGTIYTTICPE